MSCEIDIDFDVAPVFVRHHRKARKVHTCNACKCDIRVGDLYTLSKWGGGDYAFEQVRRCERCQAIFEHLQKRMPRDEYTDPELNCGHEYRERWGEDPPEWLAALAFWLPGDTPPARHACSSHPTQHPWEWRNGLSRKASHRCDGSVEDNSRWEWMA